MNRMPASIPKQTVIKRRHCTMRLAANTSRSLLDAFSAPVRLRRDDALVWQALLNCGMRSTSGVRRMRRGFIHARNAIFKVAASIMSKFGAAFEGFCDGTSVHCSMYNAEVE